MEASYIDTNRRAPAELNQDGTSQSRDMDIFRTTLNDGTNIDIVILEDGQA